MEESTSEQSMEELRSSVRKSLPELANIGDASLREKVVNAWALALSETEFRSIDEIRGSGRLQGPPLKGGSQSDHLRGVALLSVAMANCLEEFVGAFGVDRDLLIACALCHDIGKAFEFSPQNQARWRKNPATSGWPSLRHPVYGAHICLTAGLPEAVAHTAGAHSAEGENVQRSLENTIVHFADHAFWQILNRGHKLDGYYPGLDPVAPPS